MADDEKDGQAESETSGLNTPRSEPSSEWTASDARGPLHAAEPGGEHPLRAPETSASETLVPETSAPETVTAHDESAHTGAQPGAAPSSKASTPEPTASFEPRSAVAAPVRPRSFIPVLTGLVAGALIGAGSAAMVYRYEQGDISVDSRVAALGARVDGLERRPDPQGTIDNLKTSIADLDGKMDAVAKNATKGPTFDPAPLREQIAGLRGKIAGLQGKVDGLQGKVDGLQGQDAAVKGLGDKMAALAAAVAGIQKQSSTAQTSIDTLQTNQKSLEGKITSAPSLAVVADSLVEQIDRGEPYAGQVDALSALGADPAKIAVLRENAAKGVPSAKVLAVKFEPLADPIAAVAHRAPPNAGFMERLKSGMFSMVSIRRADDTSGDDLASRVARIQADLAHDDVTGAYATWDALPADAKAKSDAWGALAKTHAEAMNAARALQQQAIASMSGRKS